MKRSFMAGLASLLVMAGTAYCHDSQSTGATTPSKVLDACIAKAAGVDASIADCSEAEIARQDKLLNTAYKELIGRSDADSKAALQKAERAWIAFRDAQCDYEYKQEGGGTLARVLFSSCRLNFTIERVKALQGFLALERDYGKK